MKKLFLIINVLCICSVFFAQSYGPGGVVGPAIWERSDKIIANGSSKKSAILNFNNVYYLDEFSLMEIDLNGMDLSKMTVFTVYEPIDSLHERKVWEFASNLESEHILTTHRFADWKSDKYMNFVEKTKGLATINTYSKFEKVNGDDINSTRLLVGSKTISRGIPVSAFKGKVAEIIIYDRALSDLDKNKVQSYLSIKYGIPNSSRFNNYLFNSKGEVIFENKLNKGFDQNVVGLGRDDASDLYQKQSSNSHEAELLSIGMEMIHDLNDQNTASIDDLNFLIWSDNNKGMEWQENKPYSSPIPRVWRMNVKGDFSSQPSTLRFDSKRLKWNFESNKTCWLIIDSTKEGNFDLKSTSYIEAVNITNDGKAIFENIIWDQNISDVQHFSFIAAPKLLPLIEAKNPECDLSSSGGLTIGAVGGAEPYQVIVHQDSKEILKKKIYKSEFVELDHLQIGEYTIDVIDNSGVKTRDKIHLFHTDGPLLELKDGFSIHDNKFISLEDFTSEDLNFTWIDPKGVKEWESTIELNKPGVYTLQVEKDGCINSTSFEVPASMGLDNISQFTIKPNPAPNGKFNLNIYLNKVDSYKVCINNLQGIPVHQEVLGGADFYNRTFDLDLSPGIYFVTLRNQFEERTEKLVVKNTY